MLCINSIYENKKYTWMNIYFKRMWTVHMVSKNFTNNFFFHVLYFSRYLGLHETSYWTPSKFTYFIIYRRYRHVQNSHLQSLWIVTFCHTILTGIAHTEKTTFPIPFKLNGIWWWWQFSFRFWTKWTSIWFKIQRKTVTTI